MKINRNSLVLTVSLPLLLSQALGNPDHISDRSVKHPNILWITGEVKGK
jgi:hypothetical protein